MNEEILGKMGVETKPFQKAVAECQDLEAQEVYDHMDIATEVAGANARRGIPDDQGQERGRDLQ